jgi:hypothetical protein
MNNAQLCAPIQRDLCTPNATEARAPGSATLQHGNLMERRDRFQPQRGEVRGSLRATGIAPLSDSAINAGYPQTFKTTNEIGRTKF